MVKDAALGAAAAEETARDRNRAFTKILRRDIRVSRL
jgi:hypothetical protein